MFIFLNSDIEAFIQKKMNVKEKNVNKKANGVYIFTAKFKNWFVIPFHHHSFLIFNFNLIFFFSISISF